MEKATATSACRGGHKTEGDACGRFVCPRPLSRCPRTAVRAGRTRAALPLLFPVLLMESETSSAILSDHAPCTGSCASGCANQIGRRASPWSQRRGEPPDSQSAWIPGPCEARRVRRRAAWGKEGASPNVWCSIGGNVSTGRETRANQGKGGSLTSLPSSAAAAVMDRLLVSRTTLAAPSTSAWTVS